jgi:membrane-bound hydrogenase subunit mbhJ
MGTGLRALRRSCGLYLANAGGCGGCAAEAEALFGPRWDGERLGLERAASPRGADVLLVSGVCTRQAAPRLQELCRAMPRPCAVLALGACAVGQGVFAGGYAAPRPVDEVLRAVDPEVRLVYVPGCPPRPEAILLALRRALEEG